MKSVEIEAKSKSEQRKHKFDVVVVMGANMRLDKNGKPFFPTIMPQKTKEGIKDLVVAGKSRAIATRVAFNEDFAPLFLVLGGTQEGMSISNAKALSELITERYKVPRDMVKPLESPNNTQGNIEELILYLKKHPELKSIGILSSNWHLERAMELFDKEPFFAENGISLEEIDAESLLRKRSHRFAKWDEKVKRTLAFKNRVKAEKQGIKDLRNNTYKNE